MLPPEGCLTALVLVSGGFAFSPDETRPLLGSGAGFPLPRGELQQLGRLGLGTLCLVKEWQKARGRNVSLCAAGVPRCACCGGCVRAAVT